jgi:hypothetical protein
VAKGSKAPTATAPLAVNLLRRWVPQALARRLLHMALILRGVGGQLGIALRP